MEPEKIGKHILRFHPGVPGPGARDAIDA